MKVLTEKNEKVKLDKKDLRILKNLCFNFRTPLSEIARDVQLSRTSVENRVINMHKSGLIVGGRTVVGLKKLGYSTYHVFIQALNNIKEKKLIDRCVKNESVNAIISYSGHYVLEVSIMARNPSEFMQIGGELFGDLNINYGCSLMIVDTLKGVVLPDYFFRGIESSKGFSSSKKVIDYKIDEKDIEIIKILGEDAGISLVDLSKETGMNKDTVSYRIKQMTDSKILLQFRPAVNFSVLGLTIHAVLLKTKSGNSEENKKFDDFLKGNDDVLWCAKTFGEWQYIVYLVLKNNEELHDFIKGLMSGYEEIFNEYEILFAYEEYKYSFLSKNIRIN